MPIGPGRMPLLDHLGELRRRLTIVVVTLIAFTLIMYFAAPTVIDLLTDPIKPFVPDGKFYIGSALGGFTTRFSIGFRTALVMCSPMIVWQVLAFFLPALKPNERKWVVPTVLTATCLFFVGMIFATSLSCHRRLSGSPARSRPWQVLGPCSMITSAPRCSS